MRRMELRDLNYFLACVEHRSVTAAARAIHVAQPTLSHALARLEREAGVRLLDRRPRDDLRPTAAGRLLLARARDARAAIDGFTADLAALQGMARGELLVASIQSLNATLLPAPIARFVARYPGVALGVRTHPAEAIAQAVRHGREEIGLRRRRAARDADRALGAPAAIRNDSSRSSTSPMRSRAGAKFRWPRYATARWRWCRREAIPRPWSTALASAPASFRASRSRLTRAKVCARSCARES